MAFYGKDFGFEREENFEAFAQSLSMSEERKQKIQQFKPNQKIEKDGDHYTLTIKTSLGEKIFKFKSDVEFDDIFNERNVKITVTVNGNNVTEVIKFEDGSSFIIRKVYTDDNSFTEEISHPKWDGAARRFYKAL